MLSQAGSGFSSRSSPQSGETLNAKLNNNNLAMGMSRSIKSVDLTTIYRDLELFSQELGQMADRCPKSLSWQHDASRALSLIDEAIDLYCAAYITPNNTEEKRRLLTVAYSALLRTYTLLSRIYQRSRQGAHVLTDAQFGRMSERIYLLKAQLTGFINKTCKPTDPD